MQASAPGARGLSFLPLRTSFLRRIFRLRAVEPLPFTVVARRIYILPTRQGLVFNLLLLGMLVGAINYGLSMGFLFTFLLGGMSLSALFATWRGLLGITLVGIESESGFAGGQVAFRLRFTLPEGHTVQGLGLESGGTHSALEPGSPGHAQATLILAAPRRGRQKLGPCRLHTEAPLGLYRAWCVFAPAATALVWPKPVPWNPALPPSGGGQEESSGGSQRGTDDFDGLKAYQPGESPSRLVWKSLARLPEPLAKSFISPRSDVLWLDWTTLPSLEPEARLAHLARWVLEADRLGLAFGLLLPSVRVPQGIGPLQRLRCLNALALHGLPREDDEHVPA